MVKAQTLRDGEGATLVRIVDEEGRTLAAGRYRRRRNAPNVVEHLEIVTTRDRATARRALYRALYDGAASDRTRTSFEVVERDGERILKAGGFESTPMTEAMETSIRSWLSNEEGQTDGTAVERSR